MVKITNTNRSKKEGKGRSLSQDERDAAVKRLAEELAKNQGDVVVQEGATAVIVSPQDSVPLTSNRVEQG